MAMTTPIILSDIEPLKPRQINEATNAAIPEITQIIKYKMA